MVPGESEEQRRVYQRMDWSALALVVVLFGQPDKVMAAVVALGEVAVVLENQFVAGADRPGFVGVVDSESNLQTEHLTELSFQFATFQGDHLGLGSCVVVMVVGDMVLADAVAEAAIGFALVAPQEVATGFVALVRAAVHADYGADSMVVAAVEIAVVVEVAIVVVAEAAPVVLAVEVEPN